MVKPMESAANPSLAAIEFAGAQTAFDAGDYIAARAHACKAERLVADALHVKEVGTQSKPVCSIIVVSHAVNSDVAQCLERLVPYTLQDQFELILVSNGRNDLYELAASLFSRFRLVEVGFNFGCSGGRNLGALIARGSFLAFLDDDGFVEDFAVEELVRSITETSAVAVRGRVRTKSTGGVAGGHYDYGEGICWSVPNAEGLSIWRRHEFLAFGGFDVLLAGHEGLALWSKMYRFFGPDSFLYTSKAVLRHDYAEDDHELEGKRTRRTHNKTYLSKFYPDAWKAKRFIRSSQEKLAAKISAARCVYVDRLILGSAAQDKRVSVIATADGGAEFVDDFTRGLMGQDHREFEVVIVVPGSAEATANRLFQLWKGDRRLRVVRADDETAGFDVAAAHAMHDICVVTDISDVCHPKRLEFTLRCLQGHERMACVSFATFGTKHALGIPWPDVPSAVRLRSRSLLGMPVSLPTFAFRKSEFSNPPKAARSSRPDLVCSWIFENLGRGRLDGMALPLHQVFRRSCALEKEAHDRALELACTYAVHEELLGSLTEKEKLHCRIIAGFECPDAGYNASELQGYCLNLIVKNAETQLYNEIEVEQLLTQRLAQIGRQFLAT